MFERSHNINALKRAQAERAKKRGVTRREMLVHGAGDALTVFTLSPFLYGALASAGMQEEEVAAAEGHLRERGEVALTSLEHAPLFSDQVQDFIEDYTPELSATLENGRLPTADDPEGRSRIDYLRDNVVDQNGPIPHDLQRQLVFLAAGLPAVESRYDNSRVSEAGASQSVQAMEATIATYGYTMEQMRHFTTQTQFMRRYFEDSYRMITHDCRDALKKIEDAYFPNNPEEFRRTFLAPVIVNSYQAGIGNMQNVIKWFSRHPKARGLHSYDVYCAMSDIAKDNHAADPDYKKDSSEYAKKVTAFAILINAADTRASA